MQTITGKVYSGWNQEPLENASLILELNVDGEYFPLGDGTTTDSNGEYSFTFVPGGLNNERIKITHIDHYDGQLFPHFVPEHGAITYLEGKTFQKPSQLSTTWVEQNSNYLWSLIFLLMVLLLIIYETNGSIKWPWR